MKRLRSKTIWAWLILATMSCSSAYAVTNLVTTTSDSGAGSLRAAISNANATAVLDFIHFNIAGTGPFTITPATALPTVTNSVVIDGYTQSGASQNTLSNGDDAVIKIVVTGANGFLTIDTSNCTVRGLAINGITFPDAASPKGGNVVEGNFIGLDATGTNSLGAAGPGVLVSSPNNRIGGTTTAARNLISGHGATGIEMAGVFATGNLVQGNFIGTDKTGTRSISNVDRAVVCNSFSQSNTIGGTASGARNLISGNNDRGIVLDGTNNVAQGNFIGTDVTGVNGLGNVRSGVEIAGSNNVCGGLISGAGNIIAFNGINGFTTNGVDVQPNVKFFSIFSNSIFDNVGLGIDVNANGAVTPGFPVLTLASNAVASTVIKGTFAPSVSFRLELFSNPTCDSSGFGEGKTLLNSATIATDAGGNFTVTLPTVVPPGLFITSTGNGTTEFCQCRMVIAAGSTNSWTNSVSGKWEVSTNWSLGVAPYLGLSATLITNANTKTVTIDSTTTGSFPFTMTISNLTVGAPSGSTNTLSLLNAGTNSPLRIFNSCILTNGGAVTVTNSILRVDGLFKIDGPVALNTGSLIATNSQTIIGNAGRGSLNLSNATAILNYPLVGLGASSAGTVSIAGGTMTVTSVMDLGDDLAATGTVWISDGRLEIAGTLYDGLFGAGQFTTSNSTVRTGGMTVGSQPGARATYTAVGTTNTLSTILIGESGGATGSVVFLGGQLTATNSPIIVGNFGSGQLTVSNTTVLTREIVLGKFPGSVGTFVFAGGSLVLPGLTTTGTAFGVTSTVWVTGGQLSLTNDATTLSTTALSRVTISNGTVNVGSLTVIPSASAGSLTVAGGVINIDGQLECAGTGTAIWVTGGQLIATNNNTFIGQVAISNGAFLARDVFMGSTGRPGTLTIAGGVFALPGSFNGLVIGAGNGTGTVWQTGGLIVTTNTDISIGGLFSPAIGRMIVSNGTVLARNIFVAAQSSGLGTFTAAGGTNSVYANLILGDDFCTGTGIVQVAGGRLFVTNAAGNATLEVRSGTLSVSAGLLQANKIILSNACAHFVNTGGTVLYNTVVLNSTADTDGDGIPNAYEISHGLDPLDPSNTTKDTDGDGLSDLQEFLAGTDPTNSASAFRVIAVTRESNDLRVTWTMGSGRTNALQRTSGDASGNFTTNNFATIFTVTNTVGTTTNYLDVGGASNTNHYYRVRLVP